MPLLTDLRDLALRIALDVAPIPAQAQPRAHGMTSMATSTKSSEIDLVTELDQRTEAALTERIRAARPDDGILGEEGAATASASGYTWVIDPIDGTVNYFYGNPQWCICIGIVDAAGEPVVGVVHAPRLHETFVAARGHGAQLLLEDAVVDLVPPPEAPLELALLVTGFSYDRARRRDMARAAADLIPRVRDLRRPGSAGLDICAVAAGRAHAYYERDTKPWDRAAALAVAHEVGLTAYVTGDPMGENLTIVGPPALAATLRDELARLGVRD